MYLLDTHVWSWTFDARHRLSRTVEDLIQDGVTFFLSPVSLYEISNKVRLGKWPSMDAYIDRAVDILREQGGEFATLTAQISLDAGRVDWSHRDPFDRLIAATALRMNLILVSADTAFDSHPDRRLRRVW